jgi:site-specific DNA-methyltransferase (adenine-specific)
LIYYQDTLSTVYLADCREIAPSLRVGVIITDPPYGETRLKWDRWPKAWPAAMVGVAPCLWCFGSLRMFWKHFAEFDAWRMVQEIVWEKQNGSGLHNDRFRRVHELAVQFTQGEWHKIFKKAPLSYDAQARRVVRKTAPSHWGQIKSGTYAVAENGPRLMRSIIFARNTHRTGFRETEKPEGIIRPLIDYSAAPGAVVLDPFCGTGTTLVVAKQAGLPSIGIDTDERACEIAANRLTQTMNFQPPARPLQNGTPRPESPINCPAMSRFSSLISPRPDSP